MHARQQHAVTRSFAYLGWTLGISAAVAAAVALVARPDAPSGWALGSFLVSLLLLVAILMGRDTFRLSTLRILLTAFAGFEGLFFGHVLAAFDLPAVAAALGVAALVFLTMAGWGLLTRRDLSSLGTLLFCSLCALFGCLLVAILFGAGPLFLGIVALGVVLFALYTAYDVQWIAREASSAADPDAVERIAIEGSIALYLDLANLFSDVLNVLDWFSA